MSEISYTQEDLTHWIYNCKDIIYTLEIAEKLQSIISTKPEKFQLFHKFQQEKLAPALVKIMNRGVRIDLKKKEYLHDQLTKIVQDVEIKLAYLLDEPFNPRSTPQMRAVFKDLLGIKLIKDKKSKTESCASPYMFQYREQYPEYKALITLILEYRSLGVFLKTFIDAKVDEDNRMRTSYNLAGTKTGRLSSRKNAFGSGANLANLPSKGKIKLKYALGELDSNEVVDEDLEEISSTIPDDEEGITELPNCKELFIPDENYVFWNCDLSGADAQVVAWDSECEWLMDFFKDPPMKLYQYVASHYLQKEIETTDKWYKIFKQYVHGTHYGMLEAKAALNAGIDIKLAKELRKWYFKLCPEIPEWHKKIEDKCKKKGYVENIFGRQMWFLNKDCPTWLNQAIASIPQSTIADVTNRGLVNIVENEMNPTSRIDVLLQVHDALAGQYHVSNKLAKEKIINHMLIELPYSTPLIIPVDYSESLISYGDCK